MTIETKRLWLIEDNDAFRQALTRVVNQSRAIECAAAFSSCEDALQALSRQLPPDVILLDVGLPGMSGIDGIKLFKQAAPDTHIVMLTMFDDDDKVFKAICAGASGYLLKTAPKEKIIEAVTVVLDGGAPINARIAKSMLQMFSRMAAPKGADYGLSARETEVLQLVVSGLIKKEIATRLGLSPHTVDTHLRSIYQKLQVNSRSGAVAKVLRERLF